MIAQMSQDQQWDYCSPPCAARTSVKGSSIAFTWKETIKRPLFCNDSGAQKRVNFSDKMNRESESFSPAEPSSTKVKQSEIKEEDSQWLFFISHLSG